MEDIFDHSIKIKYLGKIYNTKQLEGHFMSTEKRAIKIQNQKELDEYLSKKIIKN